MMKVTSLLAIVLSAVCQASTESDLGANVIVFDPEMSPKVIQEKCDEIFKQQFSNQFGQERYAILFKPGSYQVDITIGFYTQVAGLGKSPEEVMVRGVLNTKAFEANTNVTKNFWRGCENFTVNPGGKQVTWAVSQAAPMRRMHIMGDMRLFIGGWASGGFLSDTKIDGSIVSGSQQQWLSRNCEWGSWRGGVWNMAHMGVINAPSAPAAWDRHQPHTVIEKTPLIQEKPFLYVDKAGAWSVFVPAPKTFSSGVGWPADRETGTSVPISRFHIAHANADTAATLNAALASGKHLLLTPGIYRLEESIKIGKPDTIVLGLGLATLVPKQGNGAIDVADVGGVKLAGLLMDAGEKESPYLVQVGVPGSAKSHAGNPTYLYDIFCRVGGAGAASVAAAVIINSNDVIGDHAWIWRADHGAGAGWTSNKAKNGLIVNGANVMYYGLFVEHFQEYQTLWNGENGRLFFYQCEIPYDIPSLAEWSHDGIKGWAGYKVADSVKKHSAAAMGIYSNFRDAVVSLDNAIEVPKAPGVSFKNVMSFWLNGKHGSSVDHVINGEGAASTAGSREARVADYP